MICTFAKKNFFGVGIAGSRLLLSHWDAVTGHIFLFSNILILTLRRRLAARAATATRLELHRSPWTFAHCTKVLHGRGSYVPAVSALLALKLHQIMFGAQVCELQTS